MKSLLKTARWSFKQHSFHNGPIYILRVFLFYVWAENDESRVFPRMRILVSILSVLLPAVLVAAPGQQVESACPKGLPATDSWELGLQLQTLVPSDITILDVGTIPTLGPILSVPLGPGSISGMVTYGSDIENRVFWAETNYRYRVPNPFMNLFLAAGVDWIYRFGALKHAREFGANATVGAIFPLGKTQLSVNIKSVFFSRMMISFGGGFVFRL